MLENKLKAAIKRLNTTIEAFVDIKELHEERDRLIVVRNTLENKLAVLITEKENFKNKNQGKLF